MIEGVAAQWESQLTSLQVPAESGNIAARSERSSRGCGPGSPTISAAYRLALLIAARLTATVRVLLLLIGIVLTTALLAAVTALVLSTLLLVAVLSTLLLVALSTLLTALMLSTLLLATLTLPTLLLAALILIAHC